MAGLNLANMSIVQAFQVFGSLARVPKYLKKLIHFVADRQVVSVSLIECHKRERSVSESVKNIFWKVTSTGCKFHNSAEF